MVHVKLCSFTGKVWAEGFFKILKITIYCKKWLGKRKNKKENKMTMIVWELI